MGTFIFASGFAFAYTWSGFGLLSILLKKWSTDDGLFSFEGSYSY